MNILELLFCICPQGAKMSRAAPGCLIVSGIGSVFQPLAVYVESFLQEIVKKLPHCLKDINDFLDRIDVKDVTWICTYEIKILYTNIPQQEGMETTMAKLKEKAPVIQ